MRTFASAVRSSTPTRLTLGLDNATAPVPKIGAFETVVRETEGRAELMSHQEVLVQQCLEKKRRGGTVGFSERSHQSHISGIS